MSDKEFLDENFIEIRNKAMQYQENLDIKEDLPNDINNGYIVLDGEKIEFEELTIENEIYITLPKSFKLMEQEYIEMKYPAYKSESKIIYTNERTTINFIFDFKEVELPKEEVGMARDDIEKIISKLHPTAKTIDKSIIEKDEISIGYFDFISPALDQNIYNFMYMCNCKEKMLLGSFNCFEYEKEQWSEIIRQVINSIRAV